MFPIKTFDERFRALLEALDELAGETGSEDLEDLNAELEDALFLISQIDFKGGDWREELRNALEELDALWEDYQDQPGAEDIARQMEGLIRMAEGEI